MHLSEQGLKFIQGFEGYHKALPDGRCQAYRCVVGRDKKGRPIYDGKWTIGFGCTEGVTEGLVWTRAEAEQAFREELSRFEAAVNRLVKVPLSQNAYDACVSLAYNCGEGALESSTLLKKINKGDMTSAAREFHRWVNSNGVKNVPGLVRRRAQEAELFLTPDASTEPAMPQAVDVPAPVADAVQGSRTIFGTLLATVGAILAAAKDVVTEAASQIVSLAPAKEVLGGFGLTATKVAFIVTAAGLGYALYARLDDAARGRNVK